MTWRAGDVITPVQTVIPDFDPARFTALATGCCDVDGQVIRQGLSHVVIHNLIVSIGMVGNRWVFVSWHR